MNTVTLDRKVIITLIAQAAGIAHLVHDVSNETIAIGNEATPEQVKAFANDVKRLIGVEYSITTEETSFYSSEEFAHLNYRYVVRFT